MKPMKASDFFDPELLYLKRPDVSYARKLVELYKLHLIWKRKNQCFMQPEKMMMTVFNEN